MHLLFVVTDAGENDNWQRGIHFADKGNQRNPIHFGHSKIDNRYFTVVLGEPGGGLKSIGQGLASVPALAQVSDQELGDAWVVIDDKELGIFSFGRLHSYNFYTEYKHYPCQPGSPPEFLAS